MSTKAKQDIKKTAIRYWLTQAELSSINDRLKGQPKAIFQVMVATGQQFSHIREASWSGFNSRLSTLEINGQHYRLPEATAQALMELREKATGESEQVFSVCYEYTWGRVSRACYALGINQSKGVLKLLKWTYARKHYETYKSKARLARDMGLSTCRWLPKPIFEFKGPTASLVQF